MTDIINEISSASQEQRTGIQQVNQAVSQMDQVTQQNAALVEQATAAAQALREAVAIFNVGDSDSVSAPLVTMPRRMPGKAVAMKPAQERPVVSTRRLPSKAAAIDAIGAPTHAADSDWQTF